MALNDAAGISLGKSFNSFVIEKGGHSKLSFTKQDMINAVHVQRRLILFQGDAHAVEQRFTKMTEEDPNFYSAIQQDKEGKLLNVFWADARGRAMYRDFGDIVSFDTTFLCNRYKMPFSPFVGCNHHGSNIHFAAALISHEDSESFEWVFRHFVECMGQPPKGILTDQCKAIGKAVENVFQDVPHRLCLFHIKQNAARNLGKLPRWKEIETDLDHVVHDNFSIEEFEDAWKAMVIKYKLQKNTWLSDAYANRHRWAPGYWCGLFWAGMSSTQRSESTNRVAEVVFSKAYTNEKFLEVRDEVIGLKHTNIVKTGNIGSMNFYDADEKIPKPVWKATRWTFKVSVDKEKGEFSCSYKLFEFRGILCWHIIKVIHTEDIECIPEKYILNRWRKDLVRDYEGIKVPYYDPKDSTNVAQKDEIQRRHKYLSTLAMHNDETLSMYYEATNKVRTALEDVIGIRRTDEVDGFDWSHPSMNRVFGRRRIRPKENNQRHLESVAKPVGEGQIKNPVDKRGTGRAPTKRNKHPAEKRSRKKKKKSVYDDDEEIGSEELDGGNINGNGNYVDTSVYYGFQPQFYNGLFP
ncbi:protein FAR1-RELATED SEQUENCE 5-like [Chenopodium quinoa]|uniref:protein FAR1-RELATED SEQUENCE 5-like n=1 Tax=Chenopodium quinoa TaxID=63459 RepID=UPI000B7866B5|nr:protein FAR1-RELATED SEQUENCE 5-like [Chenopodium quinoa]